ncbi:MAG: Uma2 family endonuclease [Isosphaeraceae bacterium]|nr:Uma2 family endonuclease [Isosphaeraceae bacterium]
MATAPLNPRLTPEEYLVLERKAEFKSEYDNGYVYAMSGASRKHNLVAGNLYREISTQLRGRPCESFMSDMRVRANATGLFSYPDLAVVCGEPRFLDKEVDTLLNPTVIVEVLSPSTEVYDRGRKFAHYRRMRSLQEYVLIAQDKVLVERYTRQGEEDWLLTELSRLDDVLRLDSIGCQVPPREIYERVFSDEEDT